MRTRLKRSRGAAKPGWRKKAALFLFLLSVTAVRAAPPEPLATHITTNYYIFGGTNAMQMRLAMIEARPWKRTMTYDAHTTWDINSSYRYSRTNGECRLNSVAVRTKVAITLPRWIPGQPVSRELVARWQKCLIGLTVHEQGHLQIALSAAAEIRRRLGELTGFATMQQLRTAADRAVNDTIEEHRHRERNYDELTRHGRTQGAIFPVEAEADAAVDSPVARPGGFPRQRSTPGR